MGLRRNRLKNIILFLIFSVSVTGCYVSKGLIDESNLPPRHSVEGEGLGDCTECHTDKDASFPYKRFDHTQSFLKNHKTVASQNESVCMMCHSQSFCSDCHGAGIELKPSVKNHTDSELMMPHRGDYLSRHRIEGRVDPAKCFRCHGNPKTQQTCIECHG